MEIPESTDVKPINHNTFASEIDSNDFGDAMSAGFFSDLGSG
jgi:hypothetical protein